MKFFRIRPATWAMTLWPLSNCTRNRVLARASVTTPSTSIASSLFAIHAAPEGRECYPEPGSSVHRTIFVAKLQAQEENDESQMANDENRCDLTGKKRTAFGYSSCFTCVWFLVRHSSFGFRHFPFQLAILKP